MPDPASTIQHTLVLRCVDPEHGMARFYTLMIERELFGTVRLVRNWGRIGTNGRELVQEFATEEQVVEALATATWQRGYQEL